MLPALCGEAGWPFHGYRNSWAWKLCRLLLVEAAKRLIAQGRNSQMSAALKWFAFTLLSHSERKSGYLYVSWWNSTLHTKIWTLHATKHKKENCVIICTTNSCWKNKDQGIKINTNQKSAKYYADAKYCHWALKLVLDQRQSSLIQKNTLLPAMELLTRVCFRTLLHPGLEALAVSAFYSQLPGKYEIFQHHFLRTLNNSSDWMLAVMKTTVFVPSMCSHTS